MLKSSLRMTAGLLITCSALLAKGAYGDELDGVSLECPTCEKLNVVPASWEPKV